MLDAEADLRETQSGAFSAYLDGTQFGQGEGSQLWQHTGNIGVGGLNQQTRFHDGVATGRNQYGVRGSIGEVDSIIGCSRHRNLKHWRFRILKRDVPVTAVLEDVAVHYRFDEVTGTEAKDIAIGEGRQTGRLRNGAAFRLDESPLGGVVTFDGVDDAIEIRDSASINRRETSERTISAWVRLNDLERDERQVIYEEGGTVRGLNVYVDQGQLYVGGWNRREGNWTGTYLSTDTIQTDTWHHVSIVLDAEVGLAETQAGAFRAYLDGELFGEGEGQQLWVHPDNVGVGAIAQGTRFHDGVSDRADANSLNGSIGDFQLYNRALSEQEIQTLATLPGGEGEPPVDDPPVDDPPVDEPPVMNHRRKILALR